MAASHAVVSSCCMAVLVFAMNAIAFDTTDARGTAFQGDVTALVQGRLHASLSQAQPSASGSTQNWTVISNTSDVNATDPTTNSTPAPTPYPTLYRITYTRSWGDDHVCLTEVEFFDDYGGQINATWYSGTSCWGCAVNCNGCTVEYGNPIVQFDKEWESEAPNAYFCTDVATFNLTGGGGSATVAFHLPKRPRRYVLRRPEVLGTAIARDWVMEELMSDHVSWRVISAVVDQEPNITMWADVQMMSRPAGRWWEYEVQNCMLDFSKDTLNLKIGNLDYQYAPRANLLIANNGYGIYIDGNFGTLNLPDDPLTYDAIQINFHFPSGRKEHLGDDRAVGEMHIIHQMQDYTAKDTIRRSQDGIIIVVVPLRLPSEEKVLPSKTESWFLKLGFSQELPTKGRVRSMNKSVDINAFEVALKSTYTEIPCQLADDIIEPPMTELLKPKPRWLLLEQPASLSGEVLQAFKDAFPYETVGEFNGNGEFYYETKYDRISHFKQGTLSGMDFGPTYAAKAAPVPQGAKWVPNGDWSAGCGDWQTMGHWDVPPEPTPEPGLSAPTEEPTTAGPTWYYAAIE